MINRNILKANDFFILFESTLSFKKINENVKASKFFTKFSPILKCRVFKKKNKIKWKTVGITKWITMKQILYRGAEKALCVQRGIDRLG